MSVSFAAVIGLSLDTCSRLLRILAFASSALTSLMRRELIATSCIRLSFCVLACSRSASLRSVSADVPHAAAAKTSAATVNLSFVIGTTPPSRMVRLVFAGDATPRRYVRLQLPRMEGKLLPAQATQREVAGVLRATLGHRRDQLHVLSHAQRQNYRQLGRGDSGWIHLRGEGPTAHYPLRDRKSTRLNSSHLVISYAVFCLEK